jgi:hypothetical protein
VEHHLRPWGLPRCVCGYQPSEQPKIARKFLDRHFRSSHDIYEHVEVIEQLVRETARQSNSNQDLALAILHLTEMVQDLHSRVAFLDVD